MDQEIINSYSKLSGLNVPRETFSDFESYISMILEKNEKINLISNKFNEKNDIIERHIIDSAQIYNEQNRKDLEKDEIEQLKHLELYLPKQLSDDEVEQIVNKIIDDCGASSMKDMGMVMSISSKQLGGKADGKKIAEIVRKKLQ